MSDLIPVAAIAPLELVRLPDHLDGRTGSNRSTLGHAQIAAQTDIDALKAWLARFLDTRTTFDSYRKESERLLLWATLELGKPLSSALNNPFQSMAKRRNSGWRDCRHLFSAIEKHNIQT